MKKIKIGDYELIDSSTVIQFEKKDISFFLQSDSHQGINITVSFIQDVIDKNVYTQLVGIDKTHAKLLIANMEGTGGNTDVMKIGKFNSNFDLYFNYRVLMNNEDTKVIVLNFYKKECEKESEEK